MERSDWVSLSDNQLLGQCEVDTYRASGPGGQKRNKTSSAVRLRHSPSGLLVIAEESRSQHENKARALRRLRETLYLQIRQAPPNRAIDGVQTEVESVYSTARNSGLPNRIKDPRFWPSVGLVLDVLAAKGARVSDAAEFLGVSTGRLVSFLGEHPKVWQAANALRQRHGLKQLVS
jgi:hypothetical protein